MQEKIFRERLKRIFTGYKRLTPRLESGLHTLGINVVRHRNHVVLSVPCSSGARPVPISSTGSDKRGGLNIVAKIVKTARM
jgi:hypothetical protein